MKTKRFKYFVIYGAMRSGSNLLEQSLNQFPEITCHGELFNPNFVSGPKKESYLGFTVSTREKNPFSLVNTMIAESDEVISGFRIFDGHDDRIIKQTLGDPECAKIVLKRDVLDSFISLKIAQKTDQWLLREAPHRKDAKVHFDPVEYQEYRGNYDSYYAKIHHTLQENGQTAFWVNYPEQKNLSTLNGIARYLGITNPIKSVKEKIRRQNPGTLREKVENYDEMIEALDLVEADEMIATSDPQLRANIPRMITCMTCPLLFAPIPGGPNDEVLRWMHALDGGETHLGNYHDLAAAGEILHTGHSQRTLFEWMQSNPGVLTFTALRHPVTRAYDAFMSKIFHSGSGTYDVIRKQLIDNFELDLPNPDIVDLSDRNALEEAGYKLKFHRFAFHTFLKFLKSNLSGQTSIRVDGMWATQMSFMAGFNSTVPIALVAKEGRLDPSFRYLETMLDLKVPELGAPLKTDHVFSLNEIYTHQTEKLTRKAYSVDYTRFGFDDYQAALEA